VTGEPWRQRLLSEVINRLHTSNTPAAFRRAGGAATTRAFAMLLAAADLPAAASKLAKSRAVAARFDMPMTDAVREAVAYFDLLAATDDSAKRPSPLSVLCACRLVEEIEAELEEAWKRGAACGARIKHRGWV